MKDKKTIFVTGGTGFVGSAVLKELVLRGFQVRALVRSQHNSTSNITYIIGDLFDKNVVDTAMAGCDAAIHLVGIIRENKSKGQTFERIHHQAAVGIMDAAMRTGVKRFIQMSALGAAPDSPSEYAKTKFKAEDYLRKSDLDYTIFRPSLIIGDGGEFTEMMIAWVNYRKIPWLFMPYFGKGMTGYQSAWIQPIRVEDVARAFVDAIEQPQLAGKTIELVGPEQMDWRHLYRRAAITISGQPRWAMGIPIWYARLLTKILPEALLPFNRAQIELAGIDNISNFDVLEDQLGWSPLPIRIE